MLLIFSVDTLPALMIVVSVIRKSSEEECEPALPRL